MGVLSTGGPSFRADGIGTHSMPAGGSFSSGCEIAGEVMGEADFLVNKRWSDGRLGRWRLEESAESPSDLFS